MSIEAFPYTLRSELTLKSREIQDLLRHFWSCFSVLNADAKESATIKLIKLYKVLLAKKIGIEKDLKNKNPKAVTFIEPLLIQIKQAIHAAETEKIHLPHSFTAGS